MSREESSVPGQVTESDYPVSLDRVRSSKLLFSLEVVMGQVAQDDQVAETQTQYNEEIC